MNIVLTCVGNFQDYILDNIRQLIRLNHENIYVITNSELFDRFSEYSTNIKLVAVEDLPDSYDYFNKTQLDRGFRGGFWMYCSMRFFYLYDFMKKYNISDVIHLENDVLIYYNCDVIADKLDRNYMYIPFDCYNRNIASIVFIPNHEVFKNILDNYDYSLNDMDNFSIIQKNTQLINNFPIGITDENQSNEYQFVTKNFDIFSYIFDAAAIGQYIGGVDPHNMSGDTTKFINETCVIKYNAYEILWVSYKSIIKPFIKINDVLYPVFNLHIHCKNLKKFLYDETI
jgi:hypothetical protein